ncbi:MAG TPA: 3-deoxy-D-manno-octulosonic acid kinase [Steroidobacteraceae bacterium]
MADVRRAPTQDGAMLYDASRVGNADAALFDIAAWRAQGALTAASAGRGAVYFINAGERRWVLRHYRRGGWIARLSTDAYLWTGEERTRPFREWRLLRELRAAALPVPVPVAARYCRRGLIYRGDLITEEIPGAQPLSVSLQASPLVAATWRDVGQCVRRFHDAGVCHADLNAHNILLDGAGRVYVVDFDRGARRAPGSWRVANLARLERSLRKVCRDLPGDRLGGDVWAALAEGYADDAVTSRAWQRQ